VQHEFESSAVYQTAASARRDGKIFPAKILILAAKA
jgi:hypothetical protein